MSDWVPPERALDNLPIEIGPPEPVALEPGVGAASHRLYDIRPLGSGAAIMSAALDLEFAQQEAGLELTPGRPLIGFKQRGRPELAAEILLEREAPGETALLMVDLSAIERFDAERLTSDGDAAALVLPFTLAQTDRHGGRRVARPHRLRLEIAREDWLQDNFTLRILFDRDEAAREVRYPPARMDGDPDAETVVRFAHVEIERASGRKAPPRTANPLRARLEARLTRGAGGEAEAEAVLGQDVVSVDPPLLKLAADGPDRLARHRVMVRCGPRALREPDGPTDFVLHVRLDLGDDRESNDRYLRWTRALRLKPDDAPATLSIDIADAGDPKALDKRAGDLRTVRFFEREDREETLTLQQRRLSPISAGVAPSVALIAADFALTGRAPADKDALVVATAKVFDDKRREVERFPVEIRIEPEERRDLEIPANVTGLSLAAGARRARVVAAIEQSERELEEALGDLYEPGQEFSLDLELEIEGLVGGFLRLTRPFRFEAERDRRVLAVDLGGAAVAAALTDESSQPKTVRLGPALSQRDPGAAEADGYFIESGLGLSDAACWRPSLAAETLWRADPAAGVRVDPTGAAKALDRGYLLALPPLSPTAALADDAGVYGARLSMGSLKLAPDGAPLSLDRPIWSAKTDPDRTRSAEPEKLLSDALHEVADFYLAASGRLSEAYRAEVALTCPTRSGPRQKARLARAAQAMMRRLGHAPDRIKDALSIHTEAEAALAHHLNRLPADGRPQVSAALYDLGAATLDLARAQAERIDPAHGARVHKTMILSQSGAEIGGDAIDLVLYFTLAEALRRLDAAAEARLFVDPLAPAAEAARSGDPDAPNEAEALCAKDALIRAIRAAKIDLSQRCRLGSEPGRYGWPEHEPFRVQVGLAADPAAAHARRAGRRGPAWPVVETRPGALDAVGGLDLAPGVRLEAAPLSDGPLRGLFLSLSRAAVERPAMRELMRFLTQDALDHLFHRPTRDAPRGRDHAAPVDRVEPVDYLIVAGRAALWPLVYEGLAAGVDETSGLSGGRVYARAFAQAEPEADAAMKGAVVLGAAAAAAEPERPAQTSGELDPTHYALLVSERDLEGRERFTQLIPESRFEQMGGYSGYMRLVAAPPLLSAEELNRSPWARSLIAPTGVAADSRGLRLGPDSPAPSLHRGPDGEATLKIGDSVFPVDGGRFERAPSLHRGLIDVTEAMAPPGYPDGVRFDDDVQPPRQGLPDPPRNAPQNAPHEAAERKAQAPSGAATEIARPFGGFSRKRSA